MVWQEEPQRDRQFETAPLLKSVRKPRLRSMRCFSERLGKGLITRGIGFTIGALNVRWLVFLRPYGSAANDAPGASAAATAARHATTRSCANATFTQAINRIFCFVA